MCYSIFEKNHKVTSFVLAVFVQILGEKKHVLTHGIQFFTKIFNKKEKITSRRMKSSIIYRRSFRNNNCTTVLKNGVNKP